jgi:UDP-glucuronate decarboxylase
MIIIITGATGFLGSHLSNRMLEFGHEVYAIDDGCTSQPHDSPHLKTLRKNKQFHMIHGDVRDVDNFIEVMQLVEKEKKKIDVIYNLACPASPPKYQAMPIKTLLTSVLGAKNALDCAQAQGAVMVQASTSEIYGDPLISPQVESYWGNVNSFGIRANYDEGKRAAEALCHDYIALGVNVKVARIFNTYGPLMCPDDGRVVSNFICQALRNEPLTIYGTGEQTRSFCYVSDMITAFTHLAGTQKEFSGPVNLGNPNECTVIDIARLILQMIPESKSEIKYVNAAKDDPTRRCPDISLARETLDWQPRVSLEEGLRSTISYFKQLIASKK